MRKTISLILLVLLLLPLVSCGASDTIDAETQSQMSFAAASYAQALFEDRMHGQTYEVTNISTGYTTPFSGEALYTYTFQMDGAEHSYAYLIGVDEDLNCTVLDEGEDVTMS